MCVHCRPFHWGRSFTGTALEDHCPCPKAPCGLVVSSTINIDCNQHGPSFAKTTRQHHYADECEHQ